MVCPTWNGVDTAGRPASLDSFYTKSAGCNSASDRVNVENDLRPQYIEYVNLDAAGIRGGFQCPQNQIYPDTVCHQNAMKNVHNITGQYGLTTGYSQNIYPSCQSCNLYPDQRAQQSQNARAQQFNREGFQTNYYRR